MSGRELSVKSFTELDTLSGASVDSAADYYAVFDASAGKVKRVLAGGGAFGDPRVDCTASTLTVTRADHARKVITLNRAAGIAVTLPDATGTGERYEFIIGTTVTSNSTTIKVPDSSNIMCGVAIMAADGGSTSNAWETAADTDTITFDGSTTGGIKGDRVVLTDIAADTWQVNIFGASTGTEATPFSATV